jgi:peptidoglycan-associated lipoprotein
MEKLMKRRIFAVSLAVFFMAPWLVGCAKKAVMTDAGVSMEEKAAPEPAKAEAPLVSAAPAEAVEQLSDVYFDFDRYAVREDALRTLDKNAVLLASDKNIRVVIEGHCDERGTEEYNIALGEKRAEAVRKFLAIRGVDASRIKVVSYGNERPFCVNHDEECWQSNRRAHFVAQ